MDKEENEEILRKLEVILRSKTVHARAIAQIIEGLHALMLEEKKDKSLPKEKRRPAAYWKERAEALVRAIKEAHGIAEEGRE